MVVQHNIASMNANRYYNINNSGLAKSLEKLSSGFQINRAGDNAAGLAVSEKMRSQIGGLTQGVKNAQDGISMIQTYEGALTETDSILQRMKTLADQAANGTYQNEVDREAIQLEFNQLNDELDQIADTDFNGVVMLNGGQMADGTEAVDGKFDYSLTASQNAQRIADQKAALEKELAAIEDPKDIGKAKDADGNDLWKTVDDVPYTKAAADNLWKDLGLSSDVADVDITFTVQEDGSFKATSATAYDSDAKEIEGLEIDLSKITAKVAANVGGTGEGGFTVSSESNSGDIANAIFNATDLNVGDAVAINFSNTAGRTYAPKNIGFEDNSSDQIKDKFSSAGDAKITLANTLTDNTMSQNWKDALTALEATNITVEYTAANDGVVAATAGAPAIADNANFSLVDSGDGKTYNITVAAGKFGDLAGTVIGTFTLDSDVKGLAATAKDATATAKYEIAIDKYNFADPTVVPDAKKATHDAVLDTSAVEAKRAAIQAKIDALDEEGVSKSNAFDQASAPLTYTDHLVLQAGARTKDAVDFTFKYDSEGLGGLKANLNCSSRTDGLGTKDLSLLTQEEANYAIDRIDNAINKVSMVRATFGATQNRLEHKIDNMNVTKENITSAESRIRDTDVSEEMANFTKNQILSQASQSMLAQANSLPQNVLQLLG